MKYISRRAIVFIVWAAAIVCIYNPLNSNIVKFQHLYSKSGFYDSNKNMDNFRPHHLNNCSSMDRSNIIYVVGTGGIGNMMFQLASALGIANQNIGQWCVCLSETAYDRLNQVFTIPMGAFCRGNPPRRVSNIFQTGTFSFEPQKFFNLPSGKDVRVGKYLTSWRYFQHISNTVHWLFSFTDYTLNTTEQFLSQIQNSTQKAPLIGVHIRRTDKLPGTPAHVKAHDRVPPLNYTLKAMAYFRQKYPGCQFVVCSDDINWCRDNLSPLPDVHISMGNTAIVDLAILAQCDHTVHTQGTFGWWGAWLAGGDVIYYDRAYGNEKKLDSAIENFYMPQWLPMH